MHNRVLTRSVLLLIITTFVALSLQVSSEKEKSHNKINLKFLEHQRIKRATVRRPGFFKTLFSVIFEQWNDTKNTIGSINQMVNDNFLPENAPKISTTTGVPDPNVSTTPVPYKITRSEFNKIIRRNLKGLVRLYNIELRDALKQSDKNYIEFKKNASIEVSKFL